MSVVNVAKRNKDGEKLPTRHYSNEQEKKVAESIGGKQQKNSGATLFDKGDVVGDKILIECKTKTTPSESISVKKEWIEKNKKEALFIGKPYQAVAISFGEKENYYIIDEEMFQILLSNL